MKGQLSLKSSSQDCSSLVMDRVEIRLSESLFHVASITTVSCGRSAHNCQCGRHWLQTIDHICMQFSSNTCNYNPGQNVWDKVLFSRIAAIFARSPLPPRCNVGRLIGKPFLTNKIAWGEGVKVGFGPKNVCFHVKNWSMVEAVHSANLSHIILARIVWMWRLNIKVRVTSILSNVWMSNLTWLMFVTFCMFSILMWLFEEKFKHFTKLHERILGYSAQFGRAEIWSK